MNEQGEQEIVVSGDRPEKKRVIIREESHDWTEEYEEKPQLKVEG
jgi:hypothetical protein